MPDNESLAYVKGVRFMCILMSIWGISMTAYTYVIEKKYL